MSGVVCVYHNKKMVEFFLNNSVIFNLKIAKTDNLYINHAKKRQFKCLCNGRI